MFVETEFENLIKVVIIGDSNVGKTNFLYRFIDNKFSEFHVATISFDYKAKIITLPESKTTVKLQVWDTAGQEKYMSINKNIFLKVNGIILMYDITNRDSYEHIQNWMNIVKQQARCTPVILVGNKIDDDDNRIVTEEEGQKLAKEMKIKYFFEASGKSGHNVEKCFFAISEEILRKLKKTQFDNISLDDLSPDKKKKGCC